MRFVPSCSQKIADHPPAFKILNSQLNREVEAFERAQVHGAHVLSSEPMYDPGDTPTQDEEEREERRIRILRATEARLARLDQALDAQCGAGRKTP